MIDARADADACARARARASSYGEWGKFRNITVPLEVSSFVISFPFHSIPRPDHCVKVLCELETWCAFSNNTRRAGTPLRTANISEYRFMQVPG